MSAQLVMVGQSPIRIADVLAITEGRARVILDPSSVLRQRIRKGAEMLAGNASVVYGMTTGVGASAKVEIPESLQQELPLNILRFHGCGTGRLLDERESAAVVTARLASICRGYSGVREEVLQRLADLLNARVLPMIPEEGSVGASGDLTPLSYLAAMLVGEREVSYGGKVMPASEAHRALGLSPLVLLPKESLALMNGTSFMMGLACLAFERARRLTRLGATLTALTSHSISGNPEHFDGRIFELKPFAGQALCARWIRDDLAGRGERPIARLQDRYSVRLSPHVF
jgi:histidine ammonia-lyase